MKNNRQPINSFNLITIKTMPEAKVIPFKNPERSGKITLQARRLINKLISAFKPFDKL